MDNSLYFVGADIALKKFDVAIRLDGNRYKHKVFANTPEGFTAFHAWLQGFGSHFHIYASPGIYAAWRLLKRHKTTLR